MYDMFSGWSRMMAAGLTMAQSNWRTFETLSAASKVIAARTPIIDAAMRSPLDADHAELARMVPEKVDAFSRAGAATISAWWTAYGSWMAHMQHLGTMTMRGRPPTVAELADLGGRVARLTVRTVEGRARADAKSLAPIHRKATSNARRLSGKTSRKKA